MEPPHQQGRFQLFLNKLPKQLMASFEETPHLRQKDEELIRQSCILRSPLSTGIRKQEPTCWQAASGDDQISISNDTWHFSLAPIQNPLPPLTGSSQLLILPEQLGLLENGYVSVAHTTLPTQRQVQYTACPWQPLKHHHTFSCTLLSRRSP